LKCDQFLNYSAQQADLYQRALRKLTATFPSPLQELANTSGFASGTKGKNLTSGMCLEHSECAVTGQIIIDKHIISLGRHVHDLNSHFSLLCVGSKIV
jgi:hypothetical protein